MTEQTRSACPECGDGAWVRRVRDVLPRLRIQAELTPAGQPSWPARKMGHGADLEGSDAAETPTNHDHSHTHDHGHEPGHGHPHSHGGWLLGVAWALLYRVATRLVVRPLTARYAQASLRRAQDRSAREVEHLERLVELYPGLCFCERHRLMFLAGGSRTVRMEQAGPLLARGDDTALAALLHEA